METTQTLRKRALQKDPDAMFRLGYRLAFGRGRPSRPNWPSIFTLWSGAAKAGHARAQFYLATIYENGKGVRRNMSRAIYWYTRAAKLGHETAMFNLGMSYRDGFGVR
jgi:TPR repeat protein